MANPCFPPLDGLFEYVAAFAPAVDMLDAHPRPSGLPIARFLDLASTLAHTPVALGHPSVSTTPRCCPVRAPRLSSGTTSPMPPGSPCSRLANTRFSSGCSRVRAGSGQVPDGGQPRNVGQGHTGSGTPSRLLHPQHQQPIHPENSIAHAQRARRPGHQLGGQGHVACTPATEAWTRRTTWRKLSPRASRATARRRRLSRDLGDPSGLLSQMVSSSLTI
jgi:hypothetical protein